MNFVLNILAEWLDFFDENKDLGYKVPKQPLL